MPIEQAAPVWSSALTTVMPLFAGSLAIAGAYWNATRLERRKAEFALLNEQLGKLYGPLYSLCAASRTTWFRFRSKYRPKGPYFDPKDPPNEDQLLAWRQWMLNVFMPMNERMVDAIIDNVHLIEGNDIPKSFLDLISHVEAYRVIKYRWQEGDYSENMSLLNFPKQFQSDVETTFHMLKERQAALMHGGDKLRGDSG
jgi:hypothetical protein